MCGITGLLDFHQNVGQQTEILQKMNQTLSPRGPDGEGSWVSKHVALAHRRLNVIDPEGGAQPMMKQVGERRYVITYNGQIYNYKALRKQLQARGYQFDTQSDTECLLVAYAEWKEECLNYLNGIFAFAIWDEQDASLFLARDRIGVKPLFYAKKDRLFLFGSELKALLAHPAVIPELDDEGLAEVLMMGPARTPGCGIFRDVYECKPGFWMRVNRCGIQSRPYWKLLSDEHHENFSTTVALVKELFDQAVKRQLVSDVPIGTMLSGGLDSSAISAYVADIFRKEGQGPLATYSVDYVGNDQFFQSNEFQPNSDAPWVRRMVEYLQSDHQMIQLEMSELVSSLSDALMARDIPGMADIDASLLLFCQEIRKRTTVVLSGECADEVFGGYPWFHREELVQANTFPWARFAEKRIPFFTEEIRQRIQPLDYMEAKYQEALAEVPRLPGESAQEARMREISYLSLTRWMPTLLDRQDRMSMAVGLEVRVPFCDHHLVEYVWNIPWSMKAYRGREKGLLRKTLEGVLPEDVRERKKSPYPKTHHPLYLQQMIHRVSQLVQTPNAPIFQLLDRKAIQAFLAQDLTQLHLPWFGQLMNVPQLLAYFLHLNEWLKKYEVIIK